MNDTVSVFLATVILFVVFRWLMGTTPANTTPNSHRLARTGSRRVVSPEMVGKVQEMFPDLSHAAVTADLQKTGSVDATIENILRDGGLPVPPSANSQSPSSSIASSSSSTASPSTPSLIQRYHLQDKVAKDIAVEEPPKTWGTNADKRQEILKQRKEYMILQARMKYLNQQKKKMEANATKDLSSVSSEIIDQE